MKASDPKVALLRSRKTNSKNHGGIFIDSDISAGEEIEELEE